MNPKWRELDLGGGGLQAANLRLARTLRSRRVAWLLMLAFPLGAHRWYLGQPGRAALFPALTAAAASGWFAGIPAITVIALLALAALLAWDLYTLETHVAAFNKRQRMAIYLSPGSGAPVGFRGRLDADDDAPPHEPVRRRVPTLAEQEALLRELASRKTPAGRETQ